MISQQQPNLGSTHLNWADPKRYAFCRWERWRWGLRGLNSWMRSYLALAFLQSSDYRCFCPGAKGSHDCDDWTETVDCRALQVSLNIPYYCRCHWCHSKVFILQSPPLLGYTSLFSYFFFFFLGCEGPDAEVNLRLSSRLQNVSVPELWSTILSDMDPAAAVLKIPRYSGLLLPK